MAACDPIQLMAGEQSRLAQEFRDLPATIWAAPSRCAGWSNARVAGHLAFYARAYRESIARALRGDSAPPRGPDGQPLTPEDFLSRADASQNALAQQVPGDLLRELSRSGDELTDTFERLAPTDLGLPAWHYSGTQTIGMLAAYRLYELAFHGWDVRSTVDAASQIRPELGSSLVGMVREWLPWLCAPERSFEATCRFEVGDHAWTTHVGNGKLEEVEPAGAPDATVRTDASTFLLLTTMRRTLADCADRIAVEGARARAEQMLTVSRFYL